VLLFPIGNVLKFLGGVLKNNGGEKGNIFFPKFYFPLYRGLSPLTDILTYSKGGYGRGGGCTPMPKGGMTGVCG